MKKRDLIRQKKKSIVLNCWPCPLLYFHDSFIHYFFLLATEGRHIISAIMFAVEITGHHMIKQNILVLLALIRDLQLLKIRLWTTQPPIWIMYSPSEKVTFSWSSFKYINLSNITQIPSPLEYFLNYPNALLWNSLVLPLRWLKI